MANKYQAVNAQQRRRAFLAGIQQLAQALQRRPDQRAAQFDPAASAAMIFSRMTRRSGAPRPRTI